MIYFLSHYAEQLYIQVMNASQNEVRAAITQSGKTRRRAASLMASPWLPIGLLLALLLVVGVLIVRDYGESWDEQLRYSYATKSLSAYLGESRGLRGEKGAFYVMVAKLGSGLLRTIFHAWLPIEAWHFMHFLSFLLGLFFFYLICIRLLDKWAAIATVILFASQPLIWGHAFINPKDIPFMAFFLGSVALGLRMIDASLANATAGMPAQEANSPSPSFTRRVAEEWRGRDRRTRLLLGAGIGVLLASLVGLILLNPLIQQTVAALVRRAYETGPASFLGRIFFAQAENLGKIPLEAYIQKAIGRYGQMARLYSALAAALALVMGALLFPQTAREVWTRTVQPFLREMLHSLAKPSVIAAGVLLGLCTSIRTLGPAAGLLIGLAFLLKAGRKALPVLVAYLLIGALVTYLTWPNLWEAPVTNFLRSMGEASDFPWEGKVFFEGMELIVDQVPRSYLPELMSLQFTETALGLFLLGLAVVLVRILRRSIDWRTALVLGLWAFLPIGAAIITRPTLYDNFRHFLFITPALFVFAGFGLQAIFERLKHPLWKSLVVALAILPGIYGLITLHPYQYVYYNRLAGGLPGAFRRFEMDYWVTSYREASRYLDEVAPPGARVIVWGPDHIVRTYARDDLVIEQYHRENRESNATADFAVISTRNNKDLTLFPEAEVLWRTGREGAVFAVVKRLGGASPP